MVFPSARRTNSTNYFKESNCLLPLKHLILREGKSKIHIVSLSRYRYCFISPFLGTSAAGEEYLVPNFFFFFSYCVFVWANEPICDEFTSRQCLRSYLNIQSLLLEAARSLLWPSSISFHYELEGHSNQNILCTCTRTAATATTRINSVGNTVLGLKI